MKASMLGYAAISTLLTNTQGINNRVKMFSALFSKTTSLI